MSDRITNKNLEDLCRVVNNTMNGNVRPLYQRDQHGNTVANIGAFYVDGAYGGVALYRMVTEGGGVTDISRRGHMTKRELYDFMQAFLTGVELAREEA